jgi:hypothetical protein
MKSVKVLTRLNYELLRNMANGNNVFGSFPMSIPTNGDDLKIQVKINDYDDLLSYRDGLLQLFEIKTEIQPEYVVTPFDYMYQDKTLMAILYFILHLNKMNDKYDCTYLSDIMESKDNIYIKYYDRNQLEGINAIEMFEMPKDEDAAVYKVIIKDSDLKPVKQFIYVGLVTDTETDIIDLFRDFVNRYYQSDPSIFLFYSDNITIERMK